MPRAALNIVLELSFDQNKVLVLPVDRFSRSGRKSDMLIDLAFQQSSRAEMEVSGRTGFVLSCGKILGQNWTQNGRKHPANGDKNEQKYAKLEFCLKL